MVTFAFPNFQIDNEKTNCIFVGFFHFNENIKLIFFRGKMTRKKALTASHDFFSSTFLFSVHILCNITK